MISMTRLRVFISLFFCLLRINNVSGFNLHTPTLLNYRSLSTQISKTEGQLYVPKRSPHYRDTTALDATPFDFMVTMYKDTLLEFPVATNMATGGVLALLGDAIAQSQNKEYDSIRATSLVSFDIVYRATQCALFPLIVDVCDGSHLASPLSLVTSDLDLHALATMEQTITNQFLVIPFIYYPVFFSLTGYLQGLSSDEIIDRARNTLVPLLKRNWLFWIPVQYFQFGYVDEPLQIPFLCVAGLAWTFILSAAAGSAKKYEGETQPQEETLPTPERLKA